MCATTEAMDTTPFRHTSAAGGLHLSLEASRELVNHLDSVRGCTCGTRHSNLGIARGLAKTLLDMLEEIATEES